MGHEIKDKDSPGLDHWKGIVKAIWTLNYINLGLRSVMPRVASAPQALQGLKAMVPFLEETSAADIIECELKVMMNEFHRAAGVLDAEAREMRELLSLVAEKRAQLNQS
jgi:hypothetical protein